METKPAIKTTEFWATMVLHVLNVAAMFQDMIPVQYGAAASALLQAAYNIARGLSKQGIKPS